MNKAFDPRNNIDYMYQEKKSKDDSLAVMIVEIYQ